MTDIIFDQSQSENFQLQHNRKLSKLVSHTQLKFQLKIGFGRTSVAVHNSGHKKEHLDTS